MNHEIKHKEQVKVMSYNILVNSPRVQKTPRKRWERRKNDVVKHISMLNPDILALQECLPDQGIFLEEQLDGYHFYAEGSMGDGNGPQNRIFFRESMFDLKDANTFWLSETPTQPSKSWESAHYRICSFVKFMHKPSQKTIYHFNTHLDHKSPEARLQGVKLILRKIALIQKQNPDADFIFTGDFNANPNKDSYLTVKMNAIISDSFDIAQSRGEIDYTFSGIDKAWHPDKPLLFTFYRDFMHKRIDHLFVSRGFSVMNYKISSWANGKCYPSDHLPVLVTLGFEQ